MSAPSLDESPLERRRLPIDRSIVGHPLRTIGFWSSIALPFLHVPLLLSGIDTGAEIGAFLLLLALNAVALIAGRNHEPA